jgi:hypothetical protein
MVRDGRGVAVYSASGNAIKAIAAKQPDWQDLCADVIEFEASGGTLTMEACANHAVAKARLVSPCYLPRQQLKLKRNVTSR